MKISVGIIDDHPVVRDGLAAFLELEADISVTGSYANANQLLAAFKEQQPEVLLLDLQMQDMSGFDLLPVITAKYPAVKTIILTSMDSALVIRNLLQSGAKGYLLKTTNQDRIAAAIRAVMQGELYLSDEVKSLLTNSLLQHKTNLGFHKDLSERELQILQLIYDEHTSQEIADKIHLSVRTVENYRLGLLQKLDVKNMAGLIKKAILMGLVK
ncbi:response regulator transcription factor [Edaphocola aurantiacus]|uniref:response regulator transcription factor n=1 Tax=Edaphocola aurantiacus TaxID=2601682 RepID=UPI001C9624DE|nr:response regulator transcription factor [Edaphocola aurantiacus]